MSYINQLKCDRCSATEDCDKTRRWVRVKAWRGGTRQKDGSLRTDGELEVREPFATP